jgi:cell division protein FtsB
MGLQSLIEIGIAIVVPIALFLLGKAIKNSKNLKLGIFEFSIRIAGYAQLEAENEALKQKNEQLRLQASLVEAAWQKLAKEKLYEDCKEKEDESEI